MNVHKAGRKKAGSRPQRHTDALLSASAPHAPRLGALGHHAGAVGVPANFAGQPSPRHNPRVTTCVHCFAVLVDVISLLLFSISDDETATSWFRSPSASVSNLGRQVVVIPDSCADAARRQAGVDTSRRYDSMYTHSHCSRACLALSQMWTCILPRDCLITIMAFLAVRDGRCSRPTSLALALREIGG
jgi:hypothetical protein